VNFKKDCRIYTTEYKTRKEAVEALKEDSRIKKIDIVGRNIIRIKTNPITPKEIVSELKELVVGPVGSSLICIKNGVRNYKLGAKVTKIKGGQYDYPAPHFLALNYHRSSICWGNMDSDINAIMKEKDYYWYAKYLLDLLEDWSDEDRGLDIQELAYDLYKYQLTFNPKIKLILNKRLIVVYNKGERLAESLEDYSYNPKSAIIFRKIIGIRET
jgi:hypothetical protein